MLKKLLLIFFCSAFFINTTDTILTIQNKLQSVVTILKIVLVDLWLCLIRSFGFFNGKPRHCCCVSGRKCYLGKFLSCLFWHYNQSWKEEQSLWLWAQFMQLCIEAWKIQDFGSVLYRIWPHIANVMLRTTDLHNCTSNKLAFKTARIMLWKMFATDS